MGPVPHDGTAAVMGHVLATLEGDGMAQIATRDRARKRP
jgi:hypothetical protein